jgi:hypothetical protein
MTTEEGNKLIAEFMGAEFQTKEDRTYEQNEYEVAKFSPTNVPCSTALYVHRVSSLLYHTSWDWQIPVVPKLFHTIRKYIASTKKKDYVQFTTWTNQYAGAVMNNDCEMGWQIITKALEWYNKEQEVNRSDTTNLNQGTES